MKFPHIAGVVGAFLFCFPALAAEIIRVPGDYATIQAAAAAAAEGDTVLVAPGEYFGEIRLEDKTIVLASWFLTTGEREHIAQTILNGNGRTIVRVTSTAGAGTTITGFTLRNGGNGILTRANIKVLDNHIFGCEDGIDYSGGSGGICRNNVIENNRGEGLDLDKEVDVVVEDNLIRYNGQDGIEIQMQEYDGPTLSCVIRRNLIYGNGHDGIQLVGHSISTNRMFRIERNVIAKNRFAGLGCTSNGNTEETFEGAAHSERIYLINNTIIANNYGVSGGSNLIALNNVIAGHPGIAMKNVNGNSMIAYCNFARNGLDFDNCNRDATNLMNRVPLLDEDYKLTAASAGIDRGAAFFVWQGEPVLNLRSSTFIGSAPDMGAFEYDPDEVPANVLLSSQTGPGRVELSWKTANETMLAGFEIQRSDDGVQLAKIAFVEGQSHAIASGEHRYVDSGLAPGAYFYRIKQIDVDGRASQSFSLLAEVAIPGTPQLFPNYPNPFPVATRIQYYLSSMEHVVLRIYNALGQEVRVLADEVKPAGKHFAMWDGRDSAGTRVASGPYFFELRAGGFKAARTLMIQH